MTEKQIVKALKISDIDIEKIIVGTKKTNKTVPITYKEKPLVFQTPFLEITAKPRKTSFQNIYQLDTLFKGDTKQKIDQWYQFIENIETSVSNQVINNGSKWFTQKNVVIKSLIRELDSEKEIYFVKWPIDLKTNIFVDEYKNSFNVENLKEKDLIKLIIELSDLWINENQCGLAIIVQKILVKPFSEKIASEYIFDDSESENSNNDENNIISLLATEQKNSHKPSQKLKYQTQNPNTITHQNMDEIKNQQHKSSNEIRETKNKNNTISSEYQTKKINNPLQSKSKKNMLCRVFSELSDEELSLENNESFQQLDNYSPSSDSAEINEEDLEFN